jgi:hypothetical protein
VITTGRSGNLGHALGTLASASAGPYGYTLSVWSSGAVLIHFRGLPNVGDVLLFAGGGLAGFTLIGLMVHLRLEAVEEIATMRERILAGVLHWFAVGAAIGVVALIAQIASWVAWPLAMFAATVVYLLGATVQLAAVAGRGEAGARDRRTS